LCVGLRNDAYGQVGWYTASFAVSNVLKSFISQAICFVTFLVGFITVLCIGNYFRAKRAQERQRQRRLAKLAAQGQQNSGGYDPAGNYEAPRIPTDAGVQA
jgi:hypothetical protein